VAKPELEDGHTQIANEILEHLMKTHLSANQWQVLLCIIRKTYGFHKKVDYIANSQIVKATGLCKAVVSRATHSLSDMKIINRNGKSIGLQKDWEMWQELAEQSTPEVSNSANQSLQFSQPKLAEQSTKVSSPAVAQKIKDTYTKDTYTKDRQTKKKNYGEFNNVFLTDEEYLKLKERFGAELPDKIEALSTGIESKGYKYKSHYAAILSWDRRDRKEKEISHGAHQRNPRAIPKPHEYTAIEDYRRQRA